MKPKCLATAIGSLPHADPQKAVDVVLANIPEAPIWPQLPATGMNEQMEIQYSEGMPCVVIDREKKRMYFDTSGDPSDALAGFFEKYMVAMDPETGDGNCESMKISPEFSQGIYALEARLKADQKKRPFVKVQTTGPCSFALTIVDQAKRAIYYNDEFRDAIVKALAMKCRWQIQKFRPYADNVICFIDEPILSAFGSSTYVSVKRDDVVNLLKEVIDAVHADKALAGIHCCGNTEWSILIDAGVDIVNFDAFEYWQTIAMYGDAVKKHLDRGGILAWGVVPTSVKIREQSVESLVRQFEKGVDHLVQQAGVPRQTVLEQAIITPSCGTGSMAVEDAEKVFSLLGQTSKALKAKYGF
jgi:metal-sulfur cluster biosynthetic enzyme